MTRSKFFYEAEIYQSVISYLSPLSAVQTRLLKWWVPCSLHHERMRDFDTGIAGLKVMPGADPESVSVMFGKLGEPDIILLAAEDSLTPGLHHISFKVPSVAELERTAAELTSQGIEIDKEINSETKRSVFVRDPDGLCCEFYHRREALDARAQVAPSAADRAYLY